MGWTSPEVMQAVERTVALAQDVGDVQQRAQALYGAQSVYVVAAQFDQVESNYAEMSALFMMTEESVPAFGGLMHAGARLHMGHAVEARARFDEILAKRDERAVIDLQESQGINYLVLGHAWNAHALWYLGEPALALEHSTRAVNIAQHFAQPFSQVMASTYLSTLLEFESDIDRFAAQAEEALLLSVEYRVPYYRNWASILVHFARAWREPADDALDTLRESIDTFVATDARIRYPYFLSLLARAYDRGGRPDEGLQVIDVALDASQQRNERWWIPELTRLRGDMLQAQGDAAEAVEDEYRRALESARTLEARSLGLRAATSLAKLWLDQGRVGEAKSLLIPVYQSFSDQLITPDMEVTQNLIRELTRAESHADSGLS